MVQTHGKNIVDGLIPPGLFCPEDGEEGQAGSNGKGPTHLMLNRVNNRGASDLIVRLTMSSLGLSRGRLWLVLGGAYLGGSYKFGRINRVSHARLEKMVYLLWLREAHQVNTSAIYGIDWLKGLVHFNEGQQLRRTAQQYPSITEVGTGSPNGDEGLDTQGDPRGYLGDRELSEVSPSND